MTKAHIGPTFDTSVYTLIGDHMRIYSVWSNGKAPLNGGGGRYIGRVWKTEGYGWVAAPPRFDGAADSGSCEVNRSIRLFRTRKDACLFLYGHIMGIGAVKLAATMATMPWARKPEITV